MRPRPIFIVTLALGILAALVSALDRLAALTAHIPNPGERLVRYYGRYRNVCRGIGRKPSPKPAALTQAVRLGAAETFVESRCQASASVAVALGGRTAMFPADLRQVFFEVPSGSLGVVWAAPLDLCEAGEGVAQVGDVEVPLRIVVREVSQLLPAWCDLDGCEGGIGELADVLPAPLRALGGWSRHQHRAHRGARPKESLNPHGSPFPPTRSLPHSRWIVTTSRLIDASCLLW